MSQETAFHLVADATQDHGASCILIGGFAVNYYGVTRNTNDVDFMILKEDFLKILDVLKRAGYQVKYEHENFIQLKSQKISLMDVDFMFVDPQTLEKIMKESRSLSLGGRDFLVPSVVHLIALKIHAIKNNEQRLLKDLWDIVNLVVKNKIDPRQDEFKQMCLRYGTEELYHKILKAAP